ncbi:MAG TPA: helix-turn-helix domain-containing protein [Candidatus Saccharimonadales bacterium]|nr:helix-turn-helix domain-containing protein [Candidatus Saccharimonadales bacterium]
MTMQLLLRPSPLTSWGSFKGQRRMSDSPFVESVWEGIALRAGTHLTAADGTIDLTFQKRQGITRLLLSGPTSSAQTTMFEEGDEVLAVRLRTGVHFSFIDGTKLTDVNTYLPNSSSAHFWLNNTSVAFPHFNNIETFIDQLARSGFIQRDIVVEDALIERSRGVSLRTIQRHFLATTGLTMNHILQIRRAEHARSLLASSHTLTSIAYEAGYSNPGHMTNAFKYFFGYTPRALRALSTK